MEDNQLRQSVFDTLVELTDDGADPADVMSHAMVALGLYFAECISPDEDEVQAALDQMKALFEGTVVRLYLNPDFRQRYHTSALPGDAED